MPMTLIQRQVLSGSQASVTFSNIPQNYQTLKLVVSGRTSRANPNDSVVAQFNSITAGYSYRRLFGTGTATGSDNSASYGYAYMGYIGGNTNTANTFGSLSVDIPNYSGSTNKSISSDGVSENNSSESYQSLVAALLPNTVAITSITLFSDNAASFLSGSTFSLYGIS